MSYSREAARDALATLLEAALVGSGKPCEAFYSYQVADFAGQSPIAMLVSAGSERDQQTMSTRRASNFYFDIVSFTLYKGTGWTEAQSQDAMDEIEKVVDQVLSANLVNGATWADIGYDGKTATGIVQILGGDSYRYESIPIKVVVYHD